jgi:AcrR family transcriptional regulator
MANNARRPLAAGPTRVPRDRNRKAKIIASARELFRERGYHAVGIDDIGEAAGITGPGVYRHFDGKQDLLVAALRGTVNEIWQDIEGHEDDPPDEVLRRYVMGHIDFAIRNADMVVLWYQESRNLPEDAWLEQRRLQRRYVEAWAGTLRAVRPELTAPQARLMVHATIGLIHSIANYQSTLRREQIVEILATMGLAALGS